MSNHQIDLNELSRIKELFRLFNNGKHLSRVAEPALWAELERQQGAYIELFSMLGFDLRCDARGFAWFHTEDASSHASKTTRRLALLFLVLFEYQADAGKPLQRFADWRIDKTLLNDLGEKYRDLLAAEELDAEALRGLLGAAERYGFARNEAGVWYLLPAVYRYLDHFEELALQRDGQPQPTGWAAESDELPQGEEG